jgi:hypothetical protein
VASCPACKAEWSEEVTQCPICGHEIAEGEREAWVLIGFIADKLSADFAKETLSAYEIPAVVVSKSGFFGNVGLTLTEFYSGKSGQFEVSVPTSQVEEAVELLVMTLGAKWQRKE